MYRRRYAKPEAGGDPQGAEPRRAHWFLKLFIGIVTLLVVSNVLLQFFIVDALMLDRFRPVRGDSLAQMGVMMLIVAAIMYFILPMTVVSFVAALTFTKSHLEYGGAKLGMAFFWLATLMPFAMWGLIEYQPGPIVGGFYAWRATPAPKVDPAIREMERLSSADQRLAGRMHAIDAELLDEAGCIGTSVYVEGCKEEVRRRAASTPPAPKPPPRDPAWDVVAGKEVRSVAAHSKEISQVAVSRDGRLLASAGLDGKMKIWDAGSGRELRTLSGASGFYAVAFSPDGKTVASGDADGGVVVWDSRSGAQRRRFDTPDAVFALAFSADGRLLAMGNRDRSVKVWEVATGREVLSAEHGYMVTSVAFAADGATLMGGDADGYVRFWSHKDRAQVRVIDGGKMGFAHTAVSADGRVIAHGVDVWNSEAGRDVARLKESSDLGYALAITPDGRTVVAAGSDQSVRLWEAGTGRHVALVGKHAGDVRSAVLSPDGTLVVAGSDDGVLKVWRLPD